MFNVTIIYVTTYPSAQLVTSPRIDPDFPPAAAAVLQDPDISSKGDLNVAVNSGKISNACEPLIIVLCSGDFMVTRSKVNKTIGVSHPLHVPLTQLHFSRKPCAPATPIRCDVTRSTRNCHDNDVTLMEDRMFVISDANHLFLQQPLNLIGSKSLNFLKVNNF